MIQRSKRRTARRRLKRIAVFVLLAASAPLWFGRWGSHTLSHARELIASAKDSSPAGAQPGPAPSRDAIYLAATGIGDLDANADLAGALPPSGDREGCILDEPAGPQTPAPRPPGAQTPPPAAEPPAARPSPRPRPEPAPRTRTMRMLVTAYCPCEICCAGQCDGITASGKTIYANRSRFVAADARVLGFGTRVSIPGYHGGAPVPVLDRGGKIKGRRLDVFFLSHSQAKSWGARWMTVTVYDK